MFLRVLSLALTVVAGLVPAAPAASSEASLVDDRAAIELVYYNHRTGTKPPFEQTLPPAQIEKLVALELKKEAVLKRVYGVEITDAMIEAEVRRINETTRAPDVLAELKSALGNDPARFARSMAKPIVVERTLRVRFENDDKLHAPERGKIEALRTSLLKSGSTTYAGSPCRDQGGQAGRCAGIDLSTDAATGGRQTGRPAQRAVRADRGQGAAAAPIRSRPRRRSRRCSRRPRNRRSSASARLYFEDLPPELQNVLRAQLQKPGDVSAVIETSQGFLLYLARDRTAETLLVAVLSLPKRSYEEWLSTAPK